MKKNTKYILFLVFFFISITKVNALENDTEITMDFIPNVYYNQVIDGVLHWSRCPIFKALGKVVYCIEPGVPIRDLIYSSYDGWNYTTYDPIIWKKIELYGYYGYGYPGHENISYFIATQKLIWEALGVDEVYYTDHGYGGGNRYLIDMQIGEINNLILNHSKRPSFNNVILNGFANDTFILTDTNNELSNYTIHTNSDKEVTLNNNLLTIKTHNLNDEPVVLKKDFNVKTIIYKRPSYQTLAKLGMTNQQIYSNINFRIVSGKINFKFEEEEGYLGDSSLYGALYEISNSDGYHAPIQTDSEGKAVLDDLGKGTYHIRQLEPSKGYKRDGRSYHLTIDTDNLNNTVVLKREVIKRQIVINKFYENSILGICNKEKDISFAIYNEDDLVQTITTDEFGLATILLPYGKYIIKQLNTTLNYELIPDFEINITDESEDVISYDLYDKNIIETLLLNSISLEDNSDQPETNIIDFIIPKTSGENNSLYILFFLIGILLIKRENINEK